MDAIPEYLWDEYVRVFCPQESSGDGILGGIAQPMKCYMSDAHRSRWTIPAALAEISEIVCKSESVHLLPDQAIIRICNAERRRKGLFKPSKG